MTNQPSNQDHVNLSEESSRPCDTSDPRPTHIYFYYMRLPSNYSSSGSESPFHIPMKVYVEPLADTATVDRDFIKHVICCADNNDIQSKGTSMKDVPLRHRSYMIFALVSEETELRGVTFVYKPDETKINHSFCGFKSIPLEDSLSAIVCINERRKVSGGPLGKRSETFKVDFTTKPKMAPSHEETTTNVGP